MILPRKLPIGYDDFGKIIDKKLNFVDKTGFIKEILDNEAIEATVITRPRRFGKTLNLSLLHYFLAPHVYGKQTQGLFDSLKIAKQGSVYMQHQGQYPVVSITFKDIKESSYASAYANLAALMRRVYFEHRHLLVSQQLADHQKETFASILNEKASEAALKTALLDLMQGLYLHHGVKPWLLIDEYDTPLQAGYLYGYYDQMIALMRALFGLVLKNNPYLNRAVITGILRIAKESLFSGVNNLKVYSLLQTSYSEHFGFTDAEVDETLKTFHLLDKSAEIKAWYNGYQMGAERLYNPWSIANCIQENGLIKPYWINTSDNQLIKDLLKQSPLPFKIEFEQLMQGASTEQLIDENMVFADLNKNPSAAWSLLLMSGYLTPVVCQTMWNGTLCQLRVPNQEVNNLYRQMVSLWLANGYGLLWYDSLIKSLLTGNIAFFQVHLEKIMLQIVSYHDLAKEPEAFYHGLLLGLIASLNPTHVIQSNRESGLGRFDILIMPKAAHSGEAGVILELKVKGEAETLEGSARQALQQIEQKKYNEVLKQAGMDKVVKVGIGFQGKNYALAYALQGFGLTTESSSGEH